MAVPESTTTFVREYYEYNRETGTKKVLSRWHYDTRKFTNGPVLVENFDSVDMQKEKRGTKKK